MTEQNRATPSAQNERTYDGQAAKVGAIAEEKILAWLQQLPNVAEVEDVRDVQPMRIMDVDFLVRLRNGRIQLVEAKSDFHLGKSGSVLFELCRLNHRGATANAAVLGWSFRTRADWLAFYVPSRNQIWTVSFMDYRKGFQTYTEAARNQTEFRLVPTDSGKSTLTALIPEAYVNFKKFDVPTEDEPKC